ncbi:hypothetical protein KMW28_22300 [Flammeovirga yaeyamensis]|uniref:ATP-binding protein n=1 Tax=Flammeovirga yaeyamensis TaxID=367791 RepID=A0AAX1NC70_9BACT|nr:hypothetical protein [Flammeovirga yaeyamensis]MBB3696909.1 hypothetical protein [Flammeovirga yaeyamensis]NMF33573.1 hypothetical protein [Flammeovirga yaeyamensis]QWG05158.1 hypothetical protein KMW28_22300 [Flammeovirga yaeyamensis]
MKKKRASLFFLKRRFIKIQKKKDFRKKYLRIKNSSRLSQAQIQFSKRIKKSICKPLPEFSSFREKPEILINYINDLQLNINNRKEIYINMKNVKSISQGAIISILSIINQRNDNNLPIFGSIPKNNKVAKILESSGFYNSLKGNDVGYNQSPNIILNNRHSQVDPVLCDEIVQKAMQTICGVKKRNSKLYGLIMEMMANSINHGYPKGNNLLNLTFRSAWFIKKSWLLSISHQKEKVTFVFLDYGVGILETIKLKLGQKVLNSISPRNEKILLQVFNGKIGSRTGLPFRGKGLPKIYTSFQQNYISDLFVLTNNVILDYKNQNFYKLKSDFNGTLYIFEIDKTCL